jgi:hypothetical protein
LAAGPALAADVAAEAKAAGISSATLSRARSLLGIVSTLLPGGRRGGITQWCLDAPSANHSSADRGDRPA